MQEVIALPAVSGKQIRIDSVFVKLCTEKYGYIASAMVTIDVGGIEKKLAEWTSKATSDELKTKNLAFLVPAEQSATLYFHLKTSSSAYKAIMRMRGCTYSLIDVPVISPEEPELPTEQEEPETPIPVVHLQVICSSEQDARDLAESIKDRIGERGIGIYTKA